MAVSTKIAKKAAKKSQLTAPKFRRAAEEMQGLCITCNHAAGCVFRKRNKKPVLFCEEFDSSVPTVEEQIVEESYPTVEEMREWDEFKGLCVNCENRNDCMIRNRDIGVWHCEEYR
ncbi:MAG: hypothetical protein N2248_02725 [candidate division WOR-3 bacterium]|uniref:Uncharacterized protein n=1 Tax=candidate division WOR-3 bacterium TaxID=2052148 RepID=A0A7C1NBK4_UNCW3|nr:hypothetical protein [candidate division WOR-3 bacterium]